MEAELELVTSATPGIAIGGVCEGLSAAPRIESDDPGRRARVGDEKEIDVHHITSLSILPDLGACIPDRVRSG